jgi:hypothetical protein
MINTAICLSFLSSPDKTNGELFSGRFGTFS